MFRTGRALVPFDLAAARRFCDTHCDGPFGSSLRERIARRWAARTRRAALDWLASPQNEETRLAIRYSCVWGAGRAAAVPWMKARIEADPAGAWLEPICRSHAECGQGLDPVAGLAAADKWDPQSANGHGRDLRAWRHADEAAAEAWLSTASLPDKVLARVRAPENKLEASWRERDARVRGRSAAAALSGRPAPRGRRY